MTEMAGKVVVITGGNTGIGKEAAVGLAGLGARVVITSRNEERGRSAQKEIAERSGNDSVEVMSLDLASFTSIRSFAADVLDRFDHVDVLVNNAGLILRRRGETQDGFEETFGVNHLGHFLLTDLLLERLSAGAPARVVVVSSDAHKGARQGLHFDDLQAEHKYRWAKAYSKSKLANIYFARELSRRLDGTGVTVNALHPGFVRSEFGRGGDLGGIYGWGIKYLASPFAISPEKGARTSIYLASSPDVEGVSGGYFYKCKPSTPSAVAQDDDAASRLWDTSEKLVASVPA
ncbi:MAG TPA: SDR family oxidoreductase [Acidimicrobiia bacterium]|nr:SDR family oxidoreductase [Acidimicrobiia bacterium]